VDLGMTRPSLRRARRLRPKRDAISPGHFRVRGQVREAETFEPLPELRVRAYDRDLLFDDFLGEARTDEAGCFEIHFSELDFRDWLETRPDLYLRVLSRDGARELGDGPTPVRRNAGRDEVFTLLIRGRRDEDLSRRSSAGERKEGGLARALRGRSRGR
jgi:hypothetical protein